MKEEKGKWEEIIRSKLHDFETAVNPDDWTVLSGRLPEGRSAGMPPPYRRYASVAAAAIAALLIVGGIWLYPYRHSGRETIAVTEPAALHPVAGASGRDTAEAAVPAADRAAGAVAGMVGKPVANALTSSGRHPEERPPGRRDTRMITPPPVRLRSPERDEAEPVSVKMQEADIRQGAIPPPKPLLADAAAGTKKRRRWRFGMGGGSYSMNSGSENTAPVTLLSLRLREESMLQEVISLNKNTPSLSASANHSDEEVNTYAYQVPSGKVKHKAPISAGLGVGYLLNDRWALQSGVHYTFLRSAWSTDHLKGNYAEYKQNLHFVGIPLSVSYTIAEWKRIQLYASAGGLYEFNVAGKYKETIYSENLEKTGNRNLHMKSPVWSVNTRAGLSYPLWRFIHAYAEAGASYYFDNKSDIKTIRSDKPFNVSLQAGIRFGF
jgi:hypothetical protein